MPLAISQAAGNICKRVPYVTIESYIRKLEKSDESTTSLLNYDSGDLRRDPNSSNSVITTWQMSFEHVKAIRPTAAQLLSAMSHFDPQGIPRYLLLAFPACKTDESVDLKSPKESAGDLDASDCDEDITTLLGYCLITEGGAGSYAMHPLVQLSLRKWIKMQGQLESWKHALLKMLLGVFPEAPELSRNTYVCQELLPHVELTAARSPQKRSSWPEWASVLEKAADYAYFNGQYHTAKNLVRKSLVSKRLLYGEGDIRTIHGMNILTSLLGALHKFDQMNIHARKAFNVCEKTNGGCHHLTLHCLSLVIESLTCQKLYGQAMKQTSDLIKRQQQAFGKDHSETLESLFLLGRILHADGKPEQAEKVMRQALKRSDGDQEKDTFHTLSILAELSKVLDEGGKYEEADSMMRRAMAGIDDLAGEDHLMSSIFAERFAKMLGPRGKYQEALPLYRRALDWRERQYGTEDPYIQDLRHQYEFVLEQANAAYKHG